MSLSKEGKGKQILRYGILAIAAAAIIYAIFMALHIQGLFVWHYGGRNILITIVMLFLGELFTGRSLLDRSWWIGGLLFYLGLFTYAYVITASAKNWGVPIEALNGMYLALLGVWIFSACFSVFGAHWKKAKPFFFLIPFLLVLYFTFSFFIYAIYYMIFGAGFAPGDMISILLSNLPEMIEFIASHLGWAAFIIAIILFILVMAGVGYLLFLGMKGKEGEFFGKIRLAGTILVALIACASFGHFIPRIYPYLDYKVAVNFIRNAEEAQTNHDKNVARLIVDDAHKVQGTVILIIGESENRDHMSAFNPSYPAQTTPWLLSEKEDPDFTLFDRAYSNFPKTAEALSYFLTGVNQYNGEKIKDAITLTDVANKAGYDTWWIDNQTQSVSNVATTMSATSSKNQIWVKPSAQDDKNILKYLEQVPKGGNHFIVIHLEGSHDKYQYRYPSSFPMIHVPGHSDKEDAYDTSVAYTDEVLQDIFNYAKDNLNLSLMVYCSDHGEDMKYFHGDSKFTWDMVHTPFFVYTSPSFAQEHPEQEAILKDHEHDIFTNDLMFDTLCGLMHTTNNFYDAQYDISNAAYSLPLEKARTRHGKDKIADDPVFKK